MTLYDFGSPKEKTLIYYASDAFLFPFVSFCKKGEQYLLQYSLSLPLSTKTLPGNIDFVQRERPWF